MTAAAHVPPVPATPANTDSPLKLGNSAMRAGQPEQAIRHFLDALAAMPGLAKTIEPNLAMARKKYRAQRSSAAKPSVAVCGWELAHNCAGRVYTLAMLYETFADVEIIGSLFPKWGRQIWEPIRDTPIAKHSFVVEDEAKFIDQAIQLVAAHPYDIVHLSKPRAPNIFFGILYKLIWDAKVLMDIDDEELAFVHAETPISVDDYLKQHGKLPDLKDLPGKDWTRLAVGLAKEFDGITVCNTALQQRYGGEIIRHARDEKLFKPSPELKRQSREKYGIPQDKKVVLFFGTPREHKGLIETAQAIAELKRSDVLFCIAGDFADPSLKKKLQDIKGCPFVFLPNQPFKAIPEVVSVADCCILSQDETSLAAKFQTPAKLSDALAMELLVLAQPSPALMPLVNEGVIEPISAETTQSTLLRYLDNPEQFESARKLGRRYFDKYLSLEAEHSRLASVVQHLSQTNPLGLVFKTGMQLVFFNAIGGWEMFTPATTVLKDSAPNPSPCRAPVPPPSAQEMPKQVPVPQIKPTNLSASQAALVIHVYHLDTLSDLSKYAANFPAAADQFITCPDSFGDDQLNQITKALPRARIVKVPNAGQDVGALMALAEKVDLGCYDVICKIHSKKGAKEPARWRHALLRGVLANTTQVKTILDAFKNDPKLMLAGAQQLYLHGPTYIWKNAENLRPLFSHVVRDFDYLKQDWGFIAGTCFWIRGAALAEIKATLPARSFTASTYTDDGTIAHSAERMFGMMATLRNGHVLLSDVANPEQHVIVQAGYPVEGSRSRVMISDILRGIKFPDALVKTWTPRGAINGVAGATVKGWLALVGDPLPRRAVLKIGNHRIPVVADMVRDDLRAHGINGGKHAFQIQVPPVLFDGKDHEVVLNDEETGIEVARKLCRWEKPHRDYWDFQGFLKSSMIQPEIHAPFLEPDKRSFAMMEGIANGLCRRALNLIEKPLVTVVMPMFNRASVVNVSIASVLSQTYSNFELVVVDDGSSDHSVETVRSIADTRIRVIELGENRGVTIARNTALRSARGSIIAYLDSDNTWDPRFLAAHVGALDQLPEADMIYSGVLLYSGNAASPYAMRYGHLHRALLENKNYIDNNIIVHRHSFLKKLGGFDEKLRRYVDWDLILRATEIGSVYSVPMLLCHYYYGKTDNAITDNPTYMGHLQVLRNNQIARKKDYLRKLDNMELSRPVSVIIPSWQALDDIRDCIEALCARDWKEMLELIVVDNDSTAEVKAYLRKEQADGRIRLILLDSNYGFTYAVNIGIEAARNDSDIILLNNDAIALPGAVQALQHACLKRPDAGMTVPRQILPAGTKTLRTHVPFARETEDCDVNISAHHRNVASVPVFHDGGDLELSYAAFFAVYIRREVINQIGMLDAEYGRHYRSDRVYSDMMRNLTDYRMFYAPDSHFIHKLQKSTDQLRDTGAKDRGFELMFKRNQWDDKTAERLGYKFAAWDIF